MRAFGLEFGISVFGGNSADPVARAYKSIRGSAWTSLLHTPSDMVLLHKKICISPHKEPQDPLKPRPFSRILLHLF